MAIKEKRGWIWTDEEKQWIGEWKSTLRRNYNQISEQVKRYKESLPDFANEVSNVAKPFLDTSKLLLSLDGRTSGWGRLYQTPKDIDKKYFTILGADYSLGEKPE